MGLLKIVFLLIFFFEKKKKQKKKKKNKKDFIRTQLHLIVLYAKISDLLLGNAPVAVPTIFSLGFFSDANKQTDDNRSYLTLYNLTFLVPFVSSY
jgi:hypothetical protein